MRQDNKYVYLGVEDSIWDEKKSRNVDFANALYRIKNQKKEKFKITEKTINRVRLCSRMLEFGVLDDGTRKILKARLCRNRYCPICVWRKSRKLGFDNYVILNKFMESGGNLIFITFTVPNCEYGKLRQSIDVLNRSVARLRERKTIKNVSLGDVKTLEVTVNLKDKTFHPHVHMLMAVPPDYYKPNNPYYITHSSIQSMWQSCVGSKEYLYVNIKAIKDYKGSVQEISKYIAKDKDYLSAKDEVDVTLKDEVLYYLYNATKGLRFISYTGIFKEIRDDLKIEDVESKSEDELLGIGNESNNFVARENYIWHYGFSRYILACYEELDGKNVGKNE